MPKNSKKLIFLELIQNTMTIKIEKILIIFIILLSFFSNIFLCSAESKENIAQFEIFIDNIKYFKNSGSIDIISGYTELFFSANNSVYKGLNKGTLQYNFIFGDGTETGWQKESFTEKIYFEKGEYDAYIQIKNSSGIIDNSDEINILVKSSLKAKLSANPSRSKNVNQIIEFDFSESKDYNLKNEIVEYKIDFGDGSTSEIYNKSSKINHVYGKDGTFTAKLYIKNNKGEKSSAQITIKLGSDFFWETVTVGAILFAFFIGIIGLFIGFFEGAIIGASIGGIIGAILGALWYWLGVWIVTFSPP